ncbi:MAG: hypothetical protein L3J96_00830, partial [Thermoplasmata archaeon]|nr:hypothetical protein [Thermoplasmata archaeon]
MKWVRALALLIVFLFVVTSLPGGIRPVAPPGSSSVIGGAGNLEFGHPSPLQIRSAAHPLSTITLTDNGLSPALVSLTWTATSDSFWSSYEVDYSTSSSSGPWFLLA